MHILDLLKTKVHPQMRSTLLSEFLTLAHEHNFTINPIYQRSNAWRQDKQKKLIESILRGYCIGLFTFKEVKGTNTWEVLDGQQRLNTIFSFKEEKLNDRIGTFKKFDLDGETYEKVMRSNKLRPAFESNEIAYVLIPEEIGDEETAQYFIALQEGAPLTNPEKLSARPGELRNLIAQKTDEGSVPLICNDRCITPYRFNRRYLLSQIFKLELDADWKELRFPNYRYEELLKMYRRHKKLSRSGKKRLEKTYDHIKKTLLVLQTAMEKNERFVKKSGYFIPIYLLTSDLERHYCAYDLRKYGKFLRKFIINCKKSKAKRGDYGLFNSLVKAGTTKENITKKFKILKKHFRKQFRQLKRKARQRIFSEEQKEEIFRKANEKCYFRNIKKCHCLKTPVPWADAQFHHIEFHHNGGKTIPENGALAHNKCHEKFHKLRGPDIEED